MAQEITALHQKGIKLGLSQEEMAFYDALTKPENIQDFYKNNELVGLTRELTEMLRKNRTIDWQKKETARASMRKMVKRLLKKYDYPPENYEMAINSSDHVIVRPKFGYGKTYNDYGLGLCCTDTLETAQEDGSIAG